MNFFKHYIRRRIAVILAYLLFAYIFFIAISLYALPTQAVIYPAMLCGLLTLVFCVIDFTSALRKHRLLMRLPRNTDTITDTLPTPTSPEDEDYQAIIRTLTAEHRSTYERNDAEYLNMIEYYTVWAHQIKTPIASMKLTLQNEDSPNARKLSAELFRIEQYVEMVMVFLRLGSTTTDYVIREYALDPILRQSIKKFAGEFIARQIKLDYQPVALRVVTDEKWLAFVIEQVLSNALKYTPIGYIKIAMQSENVLCIEDSGIGIAPDDLPRIFENGYTGHSGRSDKRASGIGLHLCRRILANLGHTISAESEPGRGTRIFIDFTQKRLEVE